MTARGLVPMIVVLIRVISIMFVPMIAIVLVVLETLALLLSLAVEFLDHLRVPGCQELFGEARSRRSSGEDIDSVNTVKSVGVVVVARKLENLVVQRQAAPRIVDSRFLDEHTQAND